MAVSVINTRLFYLLSYSSFLKKHPLLLFNQSPEQISGLIYQRDAQIANLLIVEAWEPLGISNDYISASAVFRIPS